ncbi:S41 family peptidase [Qipengyuania sp. 1NDH17]|uniref:S41 family peptidase n=1 Tax=Qipengyuania polymorpha TaxID=2867234 RepID=A0ABS7IY84_9SPHN|nr:S41 family peptidase [Qipengyuania polymorpha]MBX7457166.1 S41 family peptidase [Qipengyuania polymorpha]
MRWLGTLGVVLLALPSLSQAADVDAAEQRAALEHSIELIETRYVGTQHIDRLTAVLRALALELDQERDGEEFAAMVTQRLREASGDGHLGLSYSEQPIADPVEGGEQLTLNDDFEEWYGAGVNNGVQKIERLEDNVMLLDLRVFPPPSMGAETIAAAMNTVAQGDALIIDLRKNGGGAETVLLVMGYLVEPGSPFMSTYNRPRDEWTHESVPAWVPGKRFGSDKPLYILTSRRTFSAAEALAYSLQAMGRATIVGEVTGGGAHPFEYRKVSTHFALDLPEAMSRHPLTGTNWQDVGVKPDVEVPREEALEVALRLAREEIRGRSASGSDLRSLP